MEKLQAIYDHAPIWLQNVMCSVSGWQKYRDRYGKHYREARAFCREFDTWPEERQIVYQQAEMIRLIRYAEANSKFYRELYQGIDLSGIRTVDDLKQLPIVTKEMLRARNNDVRTIPEAGAVVSCTGGTTGKSLQILARKEDEMTRMAVLDHFKARVGFENLKMRRATFNGKHIVPPGQKKPVYWRYNHACKQMIYSSFDLTEEKLGYYVKSLNRFRPAAIDGFFSGICDVASYIERHGCELRFQPVAVFPTSETLTPEGRALIERVFGCKVYDQYASSEFAPFVTECPNQVLHMDRNTGVIEVQENGEILVTSFTSYGTPLIRYAIGDLMELAEPGSTCSCGLRGPLVKRIQGRKLDFLYRPDGAKLNAGIISNLLKNLPQSVIHAQFRQSKLNEVTVLIEPDPKTFLASHCDQLRAECRHTFGPDMKIEIQIVDQIPRAESGKYRFILNEVRLDPG